MRETMEQRVNNTIAELREKRKKIERRIAQYNSFLYSLDKLLSPAFMKTDAYKRHMIKLYCSTGQCENCRLNCGENGCYYNDYADMSLDDMLDIIFKDNKAYQVRQRN